MRFLFVTAPNGEWLRGNELATTNMDGPNKGREEFVSRPQASIKTDATKTDERADEREAKLALWMEEVKSFIRNIDINNL